MAADLSADPRPAVYTLTIRTKKATVSQSSERIKMSNPVETEVRAANGVPGDPEDLARPRQGASSGAGGQVRLGKVVLNLIFDK